MSEKNWYALIMAGGTGTRLYPRSCESKPKQFQKIVGDKTLIEQTYDRISNVVDNNRIFVSSNQKFTKLLKEFLPSVNKKNYILEPFKKNTAPAMALATALIAEKDPKAIITTTASDHVVLQPEEYAKVLDIGLKTIQNNPNHIGCIGVKPISAHTGLGYIEKGKHFADYESFPIYNVKRFVEKPNREIAEKYVASGNFFWNVAIIYVCPGFAILSPHVADRREGLVGGCGFDAGGVFVGRGEEGKSEPLINTD